MHEGHHEGHEHVELGLTNMKVEGSLPRDNFPLPCDVFVRVYINDREMSSGNWVLRQLCSVCALQSRRRCAPVHHRTEMGRHESWDARPVQRENRVLSCLGQLLAPGFDC